MAQPELGENDLAARHAVRDGLQLQVKSNSVATAAASQGQFARVDSKVTGGDPNSGILGILLYRLTALLSLQSLFSATLDENRTFKTRISKLEKMCNSLKDELKRCKESLTMSSSDGESRRSMRSVDENSEYRGGNNMSGESLLSPMLKALQIKLTKLEEMVTAIEGKTAKGLIEENYELRLSRQHQQSVIESLQQEVGAYHQLKSMTSAGGEKKVQRALAYNQSLAFQRTLVKELSIKLDQRTSEVDLLRQRLDEEYFGRQQAITYLSDLLNELVLCCVQMPYVAMEAELKQAFGNVQSKAEKLSTKFRDEVVIAIQLASDVSTRSDFLREQANYVVCSQEELAGMSEEAMTAKVVELQEKLLQLRHQAKNKVIEQMKKYKQASLRTKDLEEKVKKVEADKSLIELQLGEEIRQTRAKLDTLTMSLGNRSSYAMKAAQSVRALVELLQQQKLELELQLRQLHDELAVARKNLEDTREENRRLEGKIAHVWSSAEEEAKASVKGELDSLQLELLRLQEERSSLSEQVNALAEISKQGHKAKQLAEDKVRALEQQAKAYEVEIKEYKVSNASLMELNRQLEAKMCDLETEKQTVLKRMHEGGTSRDRQSSEFVLGEVVCPDTVSPLRMSSWSLGEQSLDELSHTSCSSSSSNRQHTSLVANFQASVQPRLPAAFGRSASSNLLHEMQADGNRLGARSVSLFPSSSIVAELQLQARRSSSLANSLSRNEAGTFSYSRGYNSQKGSTSKMIETMQCLRCAARFPVSNLDEYERHIKECYSNIQ